MTRPTLRFREFSDEWQNIKLGNKSIKIGSGSTPTGGDKAYTTNAIPFIRSQNVIDNKLMTDDTCISSEIHAKMKGSTVKANDILLNITGGSIGRSCVVPQNFNEGNVNQHVCIIRVDDTISPNFLQPFLASHKGQKLIYQGMTGSGREGINFQSIRSFKLNLPSLPEQEKIATFLGAVDEKIGQLTEKKALLEDYKKGVLQQIFSQQIRFTKSDGSSFPDWKIKKLGEVLHEHKTKSSGVESVYSVSVHKGLIDQIEHLGRSFAAKDTSNYNCVKNGDIVYTKSPTGDFPYGIIKQSSVKKDVIVSPLYGVFTPETYSLGYILNVYFESKINVHNYLHCIIQKGAKNTINITNTTFLSKKLTLPVDYEEQKLIADFLQSIDKKIILCSEQLDKTKEFKKGLLQQMFI